MQTTTLKATPKGEYIKRKADSKTVWIRGEYDKGSKSYSLTDSEDISRGIFLKGNAPVYIGFDY
jgi:hypothetical protein